MVDECLCLVHVFDRSGFDHTHRSLIIPVVDQSFRFDARWAMPSMRKLSSSVRQDLVCSLNHTVMLKKLSFAKVFLFNQHGRKRPIDTRTAADIPLDLELI